MPSEQEPSTQSAFVPPLVEGMPSTGRATYSGYLRAILDTPVEKTRLLGEASVRADFDNGTLTGAVTDFAGKDRKGAKDKYTGSLNLSDGVIGARVPNDFDLNYAGTLNGNGERVRLVGTLTGKFKGDPIRGLLGSDDTPIARIDGGDVTGTVDIAVEDR